MELTKPKKKDLLPFAIAAVFFLVACALQIADDYVENDGFAVLLGLIVDLIFFGLLAYWTASVISRVSDKNIRLSEREDINNSFAISSSLIF